MGYVWAIQKIRDNNKKVQMLQQGYIEWYAKAVFYDNDTSDTNMGMYILKIFQKSLWSPR